MHDGRSFLRGLIAVVVGLALFHLTREWTRPPPWAVKAATALGWLVVMAVAAYAMFEIHRGR